MAIAPSTMGRHTLRLAQAYLQWLKTGKAEFPDPERDVPGPADDVTIGASSVVTVDTTAARASATDTAGRPSGTGML